MGEILFSGLVPTTANNKMARIAAWIGAALVLGLALYEGHVRYEWF